jgi:restriction system protein
MTNLEPTMWGISAGKSGEAHDLFLKEHCVALGWAEVGDLSKIHGDREAFKAKVAAAYPNAKAGAIPVYAGQLYRFVQEMKVKDLIVYRATRDHEVHIGEVVGEYEYDVSILPNFPNRRKVKWLKTVPRLKFSQGALYELGAIQAFFQIKNYAHEFTSVLEKGAIELPPPSQDETVATVSQDIEQTTCDYILKQLSTSLKGHPLAYFVADLMGTMGFHTQVSPKGSDGTIDILAHKDELGFEPPLIKVQVKSGDGKSGDPEVSQLYGKVANGEFGLFVALGGFTPKAVAFAKSKSNLRLIDGDELVELIYAHYEQFDPRNKALLPLKRVYIPETLDETES